MVRSFVIRVDVCFCWIIALFFAFRFARTGQLYVEVFNMHLNTLFIIGNAILSAITIPYLYESIKKLEQENK